MKESGTSNFSANFDGNNRMQGWSYDAAGNLLNDGVHSYTYDAECRIKTVDGTAATYTYGPGGERVRKDTPAGSTEYINFGGSVIAELNPASGAWTDYIFAGGSRIAKDTSTNASAAQYFQGDSLGSTRIMTDASGTVISSCTYAPYGEQVACSPDNTSNHYRFTGKERDAETGIDYFGARHYSSRMGRFMTPDWDAGPTTVPYAHLDNPQTLNLYSYVDNNPINGIDLDGHSRNEYMVGGGGWSPYIMSSGSGELGGPGLNDPDPGSEDSLDAGTVQQPPAQQDQTQLARFREKHPIVAQGQSPAGKPPQPPPTGPDGKPTPPPVPVPGAPDLSWKWNPNSQNPRGGTWGPDGWKGPNPPSGSWDPAGHWDINGGKGEPVDHYDPQGNPITPDQAHPGNAPTTQTMNAVRTVANVGFWGTVAAIGVHVMRALGPVLEELP